MRIAFICTDSLPTPAIKGGAIQMMIDGVSPYLSQTNELTIFSITDPDLASNFQAGNLKYIRIPKENYVKGIVEHLKQDQYDLVHVFNRPNYLLAFKEATPKSLFVLGLHNEMLAEEKISFEKGTEVVDKADHIVTISHYIKQTICKRFPHASSKTTVVYSGVNLAEYPPVWSKKGIDIRHEYQEKYHLLGKKVILFAGRLSESKGPHLIIEAMKKIFETYTNTVLVIAGGNWFSDNTLTPYVASLYRLAKQYGNRIIFTKFIAADEIPKIFLMSDIFICSSQWQEPLARVHYEAMAAGIPVITTNRGGNSEVILHKFNGYLIEEYNKAEEYTKAIQYMLDNPKVSAWLARNGRTFIEINFQYKHVADRLIRIYEQIIKRPGQK